VVTIKATDPSGTWTGDPARFTVFRDGPTEAGLKVPYLVRGSASNGVDYVLLPGWVEIPAGIRTNVITVQPINLGQTNSRSVELVLMLPPGVVPGYVIGIPGAAAAVVYPARPPQSFVRITQPPAGATFIPPANISICAEAVASNTWVATVEFFANTNSLGIRTNNPMAVGPMNPFCLIWSNVPPGDYALTAKATDALGGVMISEPVRISVTPPPLLTVVNIYVVDPIATEPGVLAVIDPAIFRITRDGPTNLPLQVYYRTGGTASNGVDYIKLPGTITIPAGANETRLEVVALPDNLVEGKESVVIGLETPLCATVFPPPPGCYEVGLASRAEAYILDGPGISNRAPVVRITSPPNGKIFRSPVNIPVAAYAFDADGYVTGVDFFAGTNWLGHGVNPPYGTNANLVSTNTYCLVWSNAPVGIFPLVARATDNSGLTSDSQPVTITVLPPEPPLTNRPAVVSVIASDPIAIEGTNCWVTRVPTNTVAGCTNWVWNGLGSMLVTNCGPKDGAFTIRRAGTTNDPLTVAYVLGGTATNGVDYATLPGSVTIPAGARSAIIPVVPLDQSGMQRLRTVILRLKPSISVPVAYKVGVPAAAGVLIYDSLRPRPTASLTSDSCFQLQASGPDGAWFRVEYSTNLVDWTSICTNQVVNGSVDFIDPDAPEHPHRFYRAAPEYHPWPD